MKRRDFLRSAAAAVGGAALPAWKVTAAAERRQRSRPPNIILIMADDVGANHYGCYGVDDATTPNIDRLAETGVAFQTCWCTPMCSPTRAEIVTGRYAHHTGVYHNRLKIPHPEFGTNFQRYNLTFARILRNAGYATAVAGKWHTGGEPTTEYGGFDETCFWASLRKVPEGRHFEGAMENNDTTSRYWHPCITQNGHLLDTGPEDFGPDIFTHFLIDFMRRNKHRPFLAYYPMVLTHGTRKGRSSTPLSGEVGDLVNGSLQEMNEYLDVLIGRIVSALDEMDLRRHTVIFFTSDNGDPVAGKTNATEQGAGVPMVVNCPGLVKARGATGAITDLSDVLPTMVDLAGVELPDGYGPLVELCTEVENAAEKGYPVDGKSLVPFLTGEADRHRDWIYSYIGTARMLRDHRWLLEALDKYEGRPQGRFYDCGDNRKGVGYKDVTGSDDPEAVQARQRFERILARIPHMDYSSPVVKKKLEAYHNKRIHRLENPRKITF